jgi:hypothetical protein
MGLQRTQILFLALSSGVGTAGTHVGLLETDISQGSGSVVQPNRKEKKNNGSGCVLNF